MLASRAEVRPSGAADAALVSAAALLRSVAASARLLPGANTAALAVPPPNAERCRRWSSRSGASSPCAVGPADRMAASYIDTTSSSIWYADARAPDPVGVGRTARAERLGRQAPATAASPPRSSARRVSRGLPLIAGSLPEGPLGRIEPARPLARTREHGRWASWRLSPGNG